jgi:hypothetical protein
MDLVGDERKMAGTEKVHGFVAKTADLRVINFNGRRVHGVRASVRE